MSTSPDRSALARRLGTFDAAMIGVGSLVGAGVFVAFAPAAAHAGPWLPAALLVAAVVAWCNATSTAQLAAVHPVSGGTCAHANERLGHWPGFVARWGFVTGKTASAGAVALAFGLYVAQLAGDGDAGARLLAVVAVLALTAVNPGGVARTARLTKILVVPVLVVPLALGAGISRTALAMARNRDLPGPLSAVSEPHQVPWIAELAVAGLVVVLVPAGDVRTVTGFSSFGAVNTVELVGCLLLAFTLPWQSVLTMPGVFAVGLGGRAVVRARRRG